MPTSGHSLFEWLRELLDDADHLAGAHGTATFADSELQTVVHSNRSDELHGDFHVIARHNHLYTVREEDFASHIQGADEEHDSDCGTGCDDHLLLSSEHRSEP